jgi:hypothetical protein
MLREAIGPCAAEVLIALWSHCQNASGENYDLVLDDANELAYICGVSKSRATRLKEALMAVPMGCNAGFLKKSEVAGMLRVHKWNEHNASLIQRRTAGKRGGRPPKTGENRSETGQKPDGYAPVNRTETGVKPDRNRLEESRVDINPPTPLDTHRGDEAHGILERSVNLRGLSWERDLRIRQNRADITDWLQVYRVLADLADDYAGGLDQPAVWLRKMVVTWDPKKIKSPAVVVESTTKAWRRDDREVLPPGMNGTGEAALPARKDA